MAFALDAPFANGRSWVENLHQGLYETRYRNYKSL